MSQRTSSATRAVFVASVSLLALYSCRTEPVDTHELLAAHSQGLIYLQRGQLPEAETQFRKVTTLAPRDAAGHINLGLTFLRGARFDDAEAELRRARRLDDKNVDAGLALAKVYSLTRRPAEARQLLESLPRDARTLYALAELEADTSQRDGGGDRLQRYQARLSEAQRAAPANVAMRIQLADVMTRRGGGLADSAAQQLEEVRRMRPEPPAQARAQLDSALRLLRQGRANDAIGPLDRFHRQMELTQPYQAALDEVKWVEGPLVGRPVLAFNPQSLIQTRQVIPVGGRAVDVRFTDMTGESGLTVEQGMVPTVVALADIDGDGTDNLFIASVSATAPARYQTRVYNIRGGFVADATERAGISLPFGATAATFLDFDNDGWLDLFAIRNDGKSYLLRNTGSGRFEDVTPRARLADAAGVRKVLAIDLDHDGDLDLLLGGGSTTRVYRNNLDGTFSDVPDAMGLAGAGQLSDAAFGDIDGDARVDVVATKADGGVGVFLNTGFQRLRDASASSGIAASSGPDSRVAVGDYDNNGSLDVLVSSPAGEVSLWRNAGTGTFNADLRSRAAFQPLARAATASADFVDYDNDGWLDVVLGGGRGVSLFHNDGAGRFEDRSNILPATARPARATVQAPTSVVVADVDGDGDQDFFASGPGGVNVLRNDGGNANMGMDVQLLGMRAGGGKNNNFGVGSRLELRAGEIYQTRTVTNRLTHFGLGPHLKADVLRVQWTNGVPQTIHFPGTDADVLELEALKGSCAFLYTWDGKRFRFVTDVMWQSALGMPVGLMGGGSGGQKAAYAPAGASQEFLRIPGDALQPRNGRYVIQLTEELWETAFVDELQLIAVDHPDSVELYVDERFPPRSATLRTFNAVRRQPPLSAVDDQGNDVLKALLEKDDVYVSDFASLQYQGIVQPHDLVLNLGPDAGRPGTSLYLRGWIFPTDASINVALSQQPGLSAAMPSLEVRNARGQWQTASPAIGFPSGKDKIMVIDLAGIFPTSDHHVRIRTNMQIYWDQAFIATDAAASPVRKTAMRPLSADLHYRGYSRTYRKGGRFGPHWFDYDSVSRESPWRTIEGAFTRFGDVRQLLQGSDDMYAILAPGDEVTIEFDASAAGTPPAGWRRTFLLYSDGWIKDADLNTAFGNSVEPLPFHAIKSYPYSAGDAYPSDSTHARYRKEYNTRVVKRDGK